MELLDEYMARHAIKSPVVKYVGRSQLLLTSNQQGRSPQWLSVDIEMRDPGNKPPHFHCRVTPSESAFPHADWGERLGNNGRAFLDQDWSWDEFSGNLMNWVDTVRGSYRAVGVTDAVTMCWQVFVSNHDRWLANHLPVRLMGDLHSSLFCPTLDDKLASIMSMEGWLRDRHERMFSSWQTVRKNLDPANYAEWMVGFIND